MIDYDKFKYRIGDKVRKIGLEAEYEIVDIHSASSWGHNHYKLKNTSIGCNDTPTWCPQHLVHNYYEPCNPAIKVLFQKKDTITFDIRSGYADSMFLDPKTYEAMKKLMGTKLMVVSTPRAAGKTWAMSALHRGEERSDGHSLDALRYSGHKALSKKVSR